MTGAPAAFVVARGNPSPGELAAVLAALLAAAAPPPVADAAPRSRTGWAHGPARGPARTDPRSWRTIAR